MTTPRLQPCISLPLNKRLLEDVISKAKDWALIHGSCIRPKHFYGRDYLQLAPFALIPSSFPRKHFETAKAIQPILNKLIHRVACDFDFLKETLKSTIEVDEFTKKLFYISQTVQEEGPIQPLSLGLIRSDMLLESFNLNFHNPSELKIIQAEFNTIASGFGWLGPVSGLIHRYVLKQCDRESLSINIPENKALMGLCNGLVKAWQMYQNSSAVILILVEDVTYNICDQKFHEFMINEIDPNIKVYRKTLTEIDNEASLKGDKRELIVENEVVAVVYFRAGYSPDHYPSEKEWNARLLIERSNAIKCPNINYHLTGTKKIQQALAEPKCLGRFLENTTEIESLMEIFTEQYSLELNKEGDEAIKKAMLNPHNFVLKPQREGGGNNYYDEDIRKILTEVRDKKERTAFILMNRIRPPVQSNYLIKAYDNPEQAEAQLELVDLICELGIFGVIIANKNEVFVNTHVGHMLRSKLSHFNETGVAAGFGALDSPYLID